MSARACLRTRSGRHIVEFEQGGHARAEYGAKLLPQLAQTLSHEFGKGFDERNLRNMRAFFLAFPNWNALRSELSWTHYRLLLRVDDTTRDLMEERKDEQEQATTGSQEK